MVLVLAYIWHEVRFHSHVLVVKELLTVEGTLQIEAAVELRLCLVDVQAQTVTVAHGSDPVLADGLRHVGDCLSLKLDVDHLRGEVDEMSLVLQESAYIALLVPDEAVLSGLMCLIDDCFQGLETLGRPA